MENPTQPEGHSLAHAALRGTLWSYLALMSGKVLNLVTTLILARLLVPEEFGLVAAAAVVIQFLDVVTSGGLDGALIASRSDTEEVANACFYTNVAAGLLMYAVAWFAAPFAADFFRQPDLVPIFRVLALTLPISAFGLVPDAMLQRQLLFRRRTVPTISRNLLKGGTSIGLALAGAGAWSLVFGQIAGEAAATIVAWVVAEWRPTLRLGRAATREALTFGWHIAGLDVAAQFGNNVDYLVVGRILGAAELGVYQLAYKLPELAVRSIDNVVGEVAFPVLTGVRDDHDFLRRAYVVYLRHVTLVTFLMGGIVAVCSQPFVTAVLTPKWDAVAEPMALLSIALAIASVGYVPGVLYKVIGRPRLLKRLTWAKAPLVLPVLIFATRWGLVGVAVAELVIVVVMVTFDTFVLGRVAKIRGYEVVKACVPAAVALAATLAAGFGLVAETDPSTLLGLVATGCVALVVYVGVLGLLFPSALRSVAVGLRSPRASAEDTTP